MKACLETTGMFWYRKKSIGLKVIQQNEKSTQGFKNFFSDNYIVDIFLFITAIISLLATTLTVYLLCTHKKLQMLIASLVLHQGKEVGTVRQKEINSECKTLTCISLVLTLLGLVMVAILHYRKSKLCRGHTFSNTVKSWYSFQMYNITYP